MSAVVYVSKARIERRQGPLRIAHLAGEPEPVTFGVHGAIAHTEEMNRPRNRANASEVFLKGNQAAREESPGTPSGTWHTDQREIGESRR